MRDYLEVGLLHSKTVVNVECMPTFEAEEVGLLINILSIAVVNLYFSIKYEECKGRYLSVADDNLILLKHFFL